MSIKRETSEPALAIPAAHADRLLERADGLSALLYLHAARRGGYRPAEAARDLRRSPEEIARAAETLRRLGLLGDAERELPSDELPEYSSGDIAARVETDSGFEALVAEAQRSLGRLLNTNDLRILFGIYDYWGLPAEVICLLIHHCIECCQRKNGDGRMPTMRAIETEARHWARSEINTLEAAEEHIRREALRQTDLERLKEALQIRGRELTPTERRYAEGWLDLGFSVEALAIAYDRTVVGTGRLTWKYMDKIVRDWHSRGLLTPEAIEKGDARRGARPASGGEASRAGEVENMRRMYEHMKKGT